MATGFPSLGDDDIDAAINSPPGILGITHGVQDERAASLGALHEDAGVTPKERYDWHAFLKADLKTILLRKFHVQIHGKRFRGE
jgi:hypothetical protein